MIAALLPLLVAGASSGAVPAKAAPPQDDPPVRLWINNDRRFRSGERAKVEVRTREDGYLLVLQADPEGSLRVLFPLDPDDDNFVRGHDKFEVRGRGGREAFTADANGRGTIYAAVSRDPFRYDGYVVGNHWDYRALAPSRLPRDPETELTELVRRMAQGNFDYDLLTYDVFERVYASNYDRYDYDDYSWGGGYYHRPYYGSGFSFNLIFGRPYRRAFYDPFYYAYDPFFYDPYYYGYNPYFYRPIYYRPIYYRPIYAYPGWYGHGRDGYYGRDGFYRTPYRVRTPYDRTPYTGYRFRGLNDGIYGDRRYDVRQAVNTVYLPPLRKGVARAESGRRVAEPAPAMDPGAPVQRRVAGREAVGREPVRHEGVQRDGGRRETAHQEARRDVTRPAVEARRVETPRALPERIEPRRVEPRRIEPRRVEPRRVEPSREEPRRMEPRAAPAPREAPRAEPQRGAGGGGRGGGGWSSRGGGGDRGGFSAPRSGDGGGGRRR